MDGFRVDVAGLRGVSNRISESRGRVGAALTKTSSAELPTSVFGTGAAAELSKDVGAVVEQRVAGLTTRVERLQTIVENLNACADAYAEGDTTKAAGFARLDADTGTA